MAANDNISNNLLPVACSVCGECQNTTAGGIGADGLPAGPVACMVCGHPFQRDEYLRGLELRRQAFSRLTGPAGE